MTNISDPTNPSGNQPGTDDFLQSLFNQLNQSDSSKSVDELSKMLQTLKEYEKMKGKETKEDSELKKKLEEMLKAARMEDDNKGIQNDMYNITEGVDDLEGKKKKRRGFAILGISLLVIFGLIAGLGIYSLHKRLGQADSKIGIFDTGNISVSPTASDCTINFISPSAATNIPDYGPVNFQWTTVPGAVAYSLEVAPPANTSLPWIFPVMGTSKTIYMENFSAAGDYQISAHALAQNGEILCTVVFKFSKAAIPAGKQGKKGDNGGGVVCSQNGMFIVCK